MHESSHAEVPKGSPFRRALRDVRKWHKRHPEDWREVWPLVKARYGHYPADECGEIPWNCAVSAIINGALGAMVPKTNASATFSLGLGLPIQLLAVFTSCLAVALQHRQVAYSPPSQRKEEEGLHFKQV